jgi:ribosomal protein S6--L-glutamate ligase
MRIVILSRNPKLYSKRRLVEAGKKRGHEILVVDHLKCNIEIERKAPKIYYKGKYLENIAAITPRISASVTFYGTTLFANLKW